MWKIAWVTLSLLVGCGTFQPFNLEKGSISCVEEQSCFQIKAWKGDELIYTSDPGYGYCRPENTVQRPARWLCKWWVNGKYQEKTFPPEYWVGQQRMEQ